jgi:hypothetical protein
MRYGYTGADPVLNRDPSGNDFFSSVGSLLTSGIQLGQRGLSAAGVLAVRGALFATRLAINSYQFALSSMARLASAGRTFAYWIGMQAYTVQTQLWLWECRAILASIAVDSALGFSNALADQIVTNTEPVPSSGVGTWAERKIPPYARAHYVTIDAFDPDSGHAISMKSFEGDLNHSDDYDRLVRRLESEARDVSNGLSKRVNTPGGGGPTSIRGFKPRVSTDPWIIAETGEVNLLVKETYASNAQSSSLLSEMRRIMQQYRVIVRVTPLRGWR